MGGQMKNDGTAMAECEPGIMALCCRVVVEIAGQVDVLSMTHARFYWARRLRVCSMSAPAVRFLHQVVTRHGISDDMRISSHNEKSSVSLGNCQG